MARPEENRPKLLTKLWDSKQFLVKPLKKMTEANTEEELHAGVYTIGLN